MVQKGYPDHRFEKKERLLHPLFAPQHVEELWLREVSKEELVD